MKIHTFVTLILGLAAGPALALENTYMPFPEIEFFEEAPGMPQRLGPLWGNRAEGPAGIYLKTPGHWEAPLHSHTADYRAIVIKGVWTHWVPETGEGKGVKLPVGSYWTQVAGQPHKDACISADGCVILLLNEEPYATKLLE